jgi:hypothetical protein
MADGEETDAALTRLQEQACELETEIWAKPAKTLADLLLRAEIALFNENGVMDSLGDTAAYYDDRAQAQLIRAVQTCWEAQMRSETQLYSIRVPRGMHVPTADGSCFRVQSPAGEYLIVVAAKLVRGCAVAMFHDGKFVLVGRIVRRPVPSRHLVIECRDVFGNKCTERRWGLKDKDVQIWRVTGVFTPAPFADADLSEEEDAAE